MDTTVFEVRKQKRKKLGWSEASEAALLDLWPERIEELRGLRKNGHIYAEIADDLSKLGYIYSPRDVQVKLQNLTQRYRKEKTAMGATGGSPSSWHYYGRVHQIIGNFKANNFSELTIESIDDSSTASSLPSPRPSASSSSSNGSREPGKRKKLDFRSMVSQKFEDLSADLADHLKKSEENDKELIEIEKRKTECLEKITKDNEEIKNALISFLNKN